MHIRSPKLFSILMLCVTLILQSIPANASVKAGAKCTSLGVASVVGNKVHTCIKSGTRLVWSKGVVTRTPKVPNTSTKEPSYEITPANLFNNKSVCQLKQNYQNFFLTGFGFPRSPNRLKNYGDVRGILVYVEFRDVKGTDNPLISGSGMSSSLSDFYSKMSYGKLNFKVDIHPNYISMDVNSDSYGMMQNYKGNPWAYFKDGIRFSDPYIDYTPYEFVVFMPPEGIKNIAWQAAFPLPPNDPHGLTSEKYILNGAVGGRSWRAGAITPNGTTNSAANEWLFLAHEIGHNLGMEHHYDPFKAAIWDLMHSLFTPSPALFAWHRFLQDWFSDTQILCSDLNFYSGRKGVVDISALSVVDNNLKTVMIKTSEEEVIVIETRKKAPYDLIDADPSKEGVLVYKVNVNRKSDEGAISIITTKNPRKIQLSNGLAGLAGTFGVGEYIETDGLRITNLGTSKNGYYVEIKKSQPCVLIGDC